MMWLTTLCRNINELDHWEGRCWYRRKIEIQAEWIGRRILLHFEAVNYRARVFLNGSLIFVNKDGFLPFDIDISDLLEGRPGAILAVEADNSHHHFTRKN